jgi:hypothetical protein
VGNTATHHGDADDVSASHEENEVPPITTQMKCDQAAQDFLVDGGLKFVQGRNFVEMEARVQKMHELSRGNEMSVAAIRGQLASSVNTRSENLAMHMSTTALAETLCRGKQMSIKATQAMIVNTAVSATQKCSSDNVRMTDVLRKLAGDGPHRLRGRTLRDLKTFAKLCASHPKFYFTSDCEWSKIRKHQCALIRILNSVREQDPSRYLREWGVDNVPVALLLRPMSIQIQK